MQLLAEPADHEQRIVDREREPQHRGHVLDVDAHLHLLGDDPDQRQGGRDREPRDQERDPCGEQRREHEDEDEGGDRERHGFGADEILLGLLRRIAGERRVAAEQQLDAVAGLLDAGLEARQQRHRFLVRDGEVDHHVGGVAGGGDEARVAGLRVAHRAGDVGVRDEVGERARDRGLERGARRVGPRRPAKQGDQGAASRAELGGKAIRDVGGFGARVQPPAGRQDGGGASGTGRAGEADHDREDEEDPASPVDEGTPAAEHQDSE